MKLELGSGDRPTDGYTHLDIRPDVGADIVADATLPKTWPAGMWDEIRATHMLEHFSHRDTVSILKRWRNRLKPGGLLYLEVPNLQGHVDQWRWKQNDAEFVTYLFGEQDYPENFHKTMFTEKTLKVALVDAGYERVDIGLCNLVLIARAQR